MMRVSRLSGYSSSSSLSSAPEAVAIVAEDAGQTLQDDLITGASKEKVAAGNEQVAAGLSTTLTPKRVQMAAAGGDLSTATTFEAAGLSRNETAACGGPSSSQADFMPSSPTVGVRSRMLARAQPLESRHSQQHTPSPSPPLAGGDDADRTAVGPSRAALEAQVADLLTTLNKALTTNDDLIQQNDGLVEQVATLKERIASLTAEGSASRVQGRMPSDESGADVGHLEQMNEATRTAIASVTQERDAVRVSLASKDADVSAASKDVATLMAKVAHLERERASAASAWEAEKGCVRSLRSRSACADAQSSIRHVSSAPFRLSESSLKTYRRSFNSLSSADCASHLGPPRSGEQRSLIVPAAPHSSLTQCRHRRPRREEGRVRVAFRRERQPSRPAYVGRGHQVVSLARAALPAWRMLRLDRSTGSSKRSSSSTRTTALGWPQIMQPRGRRCATSSAL
jgi:hypothetical protein